MKRILISLLMLLSIGIIAAPPGGDTNSLLQIEEFTTTGADGGVEAIYTTQEAPFQPSQLTAEGQIKRFMDEKGWDEGGDFKRHFVISEASFSCENPSADKSFYTKREMSVKEAILSAKVEIIESINQDMTADEKIETPGTDLNVKFAKAKKEADAKIAAMIKNLEKLKRYMNNAESEKIAGVTWNDRGKALLDGIIKKLDKKFSTGEIEASKKADFEESKRNYDNAKADLEKMKQECEAMNNLKGSQTSTINTLSSMYLFGATVLAQAESWNKEAGKYEVAVLVVWSETLQRAAAAIATGEEFKISKLPKKKETVQAWLKKQDLAFMSGPRQYLDSDGNRWYLGISSRALPKSSSRRAKGLANMNAKQMAIFCIYSDLSSKKKADGKAEVHGDDENENTITAEQFVQDLTQSFKNKTVRGLTRVYSKKINHPITGKKIYVAVYGINPANAKKAQQMEAKSYGIAVQSNKYQAEEKGRKAGLEASIEESKNDSASYNKGYDNAREDVSVEAKKIENSKQKTVKKQKYSSGDIAGGKNQSGSYMGDSDVSDDF